MLLRSHPLPASGQMTGVVPPAIRAGGPRPSIWFRIVNALERLHAALSARSIGVDGRRISYLAGGFGPVVLLVHDFSQTKEAWTRFAGGLTHTYPYYRVVVPDLAGLGASSSRAGDRFDIDSQARHLHDFLQALGIERYHVLGAAMGGEIAGQLANHWPDDVISLALLDADGVHFAEAASAQQALPHAEPGRSKSRDLLPAMKHPGEAVRQYAAFITRY